MTSNCLQNEKELENLIQAVRVYREDLWMEFVVEKYAILRIGKRRMMEGIELPNQGKIKEKSEQIFENIGSGQR